MQPDTTDFSGLQQYRLHGQAECMFRIAKGYEQVTKTIRIPEPVADQLEMLAAENHISFNQLVNQCIAFALESQDNSEKSDRQ